jgi:fructose-1,6-bisphosphatase/sedoheptulose 1,7-bisphosphatase-like protein
MKMVEDKKDIIIIIIKTNLRKTDQDMTCIVLDKERFGKLIKEVYTGLFW